MTSNPSGDVAQPSLLSAIVLRRKRVVLVTALVAAFAAVAFAGHQPKLYAAQASVAIQTPLGGSAADTPNMATEEQLAQSLAVADTVRHQLKLGIPASTLLSKLSVGVPVSSDVLTFTYSDPGARTAQIRANAFANAYLALRQAQLQNQVRQSQALAAETSLHGQIPYLAGEVSGLQGAVTAAGNAGLANRVHGLASDISSLQGQFSALDRAAETVSGGKLIGPAVLPSSPAQPNVVSYAIIGLILGLALGFGVAALLEQFDDRLRSSADVGAVLGAPVLGVLPPVGGTGGTRRRLWR